MMLKIVNKLLTTQPWAERGSCSILGLLFFLSMTRRKPPLGQIVIMTFSHATGNANSLKAVETIICGKFYRYCLLYCERKPTLALVDTHAKSVSRN